MAETRLIEYLAGLGATDDQIAGLADADLIGLASDLQLAAGLDLTIDDVAREVGCGVDEVRSIYDRLGLHADDLAGFGEADLRLVSLVIGDTSGIVDLVGTPLLRVAGTSLARLADAAVAAYVQDIEPHPADPDDLVAMAEQNAVGSTLAVALGNSLPTAFLHHMWVAVHRQRAIQYGTATPEILRLAIGFVDLVGFTSQATSMPPAELLATIEGFEGRAFEIASRHGGRIVKSIGDEVMIAAGDASVVASIALELIDTTGDDPSVAPRAGVSAGDVLFRLGDYYGPVVNLASRLTTEAIPGEVLTDQPELAGAGLDVQPAGRRSIKGFAEPVTVWSVASNR